MRIVTFVAAILSTSFKNILPQYNYVVNILYVPHYDDIRNYPFFIQKLLQKYQIERSKSPNRLICGWEIKLYFRIYISMGQCICRLRELQSGSAGRCCYRCFPFLQSARPLRPSDRRIQEPLSYVRSRFQCRCRG